MIRRSRIILAVAMLATLLYASNPTSSTLLMRLYTRHHLPPTLSPASKGSLASFTMPKPPIPSTTTTLPPLPVVTTTTLAVTSTTPTTASSSEPSTDGSGSGPDPSSPWYQVAICEEGGKNVEGPVYSGYLGISNYNWSQYAPSSFPSNAYYASWSQQVYVASLIQSYAPDQSGCASW